MISLTVAYKIAKMYAIKWLEKEGGISKMVGWMQHFLSSYETKGYGVDRNPLIFW